MLIKEVITESKLKEKAPTGLVKQGWNKLKGALGSAKGKAATDVGARANEIYKNFRDWGLRSGIDMKAAPVSDIASWFKSNSLIFPKDYAKAKFLNLTDKATSSKFWNAAATQAYKKGAQVGNLGSTYGLSGQDQGAGQGGQASAGQGAPAAAAAAGQGSADFDNLKNTIASARSTLSYDQINALKSLLK